MYDRVPEGMRPLARKWFYLLDPRLSWRKRRKVDRTTELFVEQFFDDQAEFDAYASEFYESGIVDICESAAESVPNERMIYDAHKDECLKLFALIRKRRPEVLIETGVYHGVSTVSMLLALAANDTGTLHSIDDSYTLDPDADILDPNVGRGEVDPHRQRARPSCAEAGTHALPPEKEPGWIIPEDLTDRWSVTRGDVRRELPRLLEETREIDLFFHDSGHAASGMLFEFELAWEWLRPQGVLLSPHVGWNDAFETFVAERPCENGLASFDYNGREHYDYPCSMGFAIKPEATTTGQLSAQPDASSEVVGT